MSDEPMWKSAARTVWANKWARGLAFVAIAFEIYNALILPAVRGTIEVRKLEAEAKIANTLAPIKPQPDTTTHDKALELIDAELKRRASK